MNSAVCSKTNKYTRPRNHSTHPHSSSILFAPHPHAQPPNLHLAARIYREGRPDAPLSWDRVHQGSEGVLSRVVWTREIVACAVRHAEPEEDLGTSEEGGEGVDYVQPLRKGGTEDREGGGEGGEDWNTDLREVSRREGFAFTVGRFSRHEGPTLFALTTETAYLTMAWLHLKRSRANFSAGCGTCTVPSRRLYSIFLESTSLNHAELAQRRD